MSSVIFQRTTEGEATHALVLGVGAYPSAEKAEDEIYRVNPLLSAPASARRFCDWLYAHRDSLNPPLASIRLLLSDPRTQDGQGAVYQRPDGQEFTTERSTLAAIKQNFSDWYADVNDPEAASLFFFSGHGFFNGRVYGLAEDFAQFPNDAYAETLSFNEFFEGMGQCKAFQQLFFVDCCQGLSEDAIDTYDGVSGTPLVKPKPSALNKRLREHGSRAAYRVFATSPGIETQGDPEGISDFTTVLLECLEGRAAEQAAAGQWWVTSKNLQEAIEVTAEDHGWPHLEAPDVRGNKTLPRIHRLDAVPKIPVRVFCQPERAIHKAHLKIKDANGSVVVDDPPRFRFKYLVPLEAARDYLAEALFDGASSYHGGQRTFDVIPPKAEVLIDTPYSADGGAS